VNKPLFDALVGMSQARTAFDERVLSALEASMKVDGEARATARTPIPVSAPHARDARDNGRILLGVGERVGAVTQQTPWMRWKMVGFGLSGEITETLQIESVRCLGGVNLLWHDEWTSLLAYQGDTVSLRENPIICAPNCVEFSLRNVGKYPVQFSLWALGEPVESAL
jgi:hypothetical protein